MFADLCASAWALAALRVSVDSDLLATLARGIGDVPTLARTAALDPEATSRILDVLVANDLVTRDAAGYGLTAEGKQLAARGDGLRADLAATLGQTQSLVDEARRGSLAPGWRHVDAEVIRAQAGLSFEMTSRMLVPLTAGWPELAALLERDGSRFLDVGIGAAGGSIAMCKHFPRLRVVGIDPHRAAHLEARSAITAAGLGDRIELRLQRIEDCTEENAFETAFLASKFFPPDALPGAFAAIRRALKSGGCLFLGGWRDPGDPKRAAVSRLREHLWGGSALPTADIVRLLEHAGFVGIREAPGQGDMTPILARAP